MNHWIFKTVVAIIALATGLTPVTRAQSLDQIGVTLLRAMTTNVDGFGIRVAQPEANLNVDNSQPSVFEINPGVVGQPVGLFTYYSCLGTATGFTNTVGLESGHADGVGDGFYSVAYGVATNVAHIDNYDAWFFITNYVFNLAPMPAAVSVINQSYTFGPLAVTVQQGIDSAYDDYTTISGALFVSAADNGGNVHAPGTSYNCICVAAFGGGSSIGPTIDNGRCKPDLTAPGGETSFSTPEVAGAVAVLMQAALRGDGGSNTNDASDMRTIKALLLNGAVKPAGWTNANSSPLDARYGAGVLNVFNSYEQLAGGEQFICASNFISLGAAHPPVAATNTIARSSGWDAETISSDATNDAVNHYLFNVSNGMVTATLVWNRQLGETNINDLDLFLFNAANSNLVACSTSRVDNVEHIFAPQLAAGRYDLEVLKNGGTNVVSDAETYALAWAFITPGLSIAKSSTNATVSWPAYPAGFLVETTTNLTTPAWSSNALPTTAFTNSRNTLTLNATNAFRFFRLRSPNF